MCTGSKYLRNIEFHFTFRAVSETRNCIWVRLKRSSSRVVDQTSSVEAAQQGGQNACQKSRVDALSTPRSGRSWYWKVSIIKQAFVILFDMRSRQPHVHVCTKSIEAHTDHLMCSSPHRACVQEVQVQKRVNACQKSRVDALSTPRSGCSWYWKVSIIKQAPTKILSGQLETK